MGRKEKRVSTEGGQGLGSSPFAGLQAAGLPQGPAEPRKAAPPPEACAKKSRGRLDVRREKAGRGGKTVTVVSGWKGISAEEKAILAKSIQKRCGVGGAVKGAVIEIQGDKREEAKAALEEAGFRVVFAGG